MKSIASSNPELVAEWHFKNTFSPYDVSYGSNRHVWWLGKCGHEWTAPVKTRKNGHGCPFCTGKLVLSEDSLQSRYPLVAVEWSERNEIKASEISVSSQKRCWWKCSKQHEWQASVANRTGCNSGCPYCTGNKVCIDNCLATNFPEIAAEWHSTLNERTPSEYLKSGAYKAWWICSRCEYVWRTSINNRTNTGKSGCPVCKKSSKGELKIKEILDSTGLKYQTQYKIDECRNIKPLAFDFAVWVNSSLRLIEFQGSQHYEPVTFGGISPDRAKELFVENQKRDVIKQEFCQRHQIPLLEIPYWEFKNIDSLIREFIGDRLNKA